MSLCSADICILDRLSCDEERAPSTYQEVVHDDKLHISESELFAVFGQIVGTFGQMVGVGRNYSIFAANTVERARRVDGDFR